MRGKYDRHSEEITAAIAAVMQYLKAEEELAALQFATAEAAPAAPAGPKLWALNGARPRCSCAI